MLGGVDHLFGRHRNSYISPYNLYYCWRYPASCWPRGHKTYLLNASHLIILSKISTVRPHVGRRSRNISGRRLTILSEVLLPEISYFLKKMYHVFKSKLWRRLKYIYKNPIFFLMLRLMYCIMYLVFRYIFWFFFSFSRIGESLNRTMGQTLMFKLGWIFSIFTIYCSPFAFAIGSQLAWKQYVAELQFLSISII